MISNLHNLPTMEDLARKIMQDLCYIHHQECFETIVCLLKMRNDYPYKQEEAWLEVDNNDGNNYEK